MPQHCGSLRWRYTDATWPAGWAQTVVQYETSGFTLLYCGLSGGLQVIGRENLQNWRAIFPTYYCERPCVRSLLFDLGVVIFLWHTSVCHTTFRICRPLTEVPSLAGSINRPGSSHRRKQIWSIAGHWRPCHRIGIPRPSGCIQIPFRQGSGPQYSCAGRSGT